MLWVEHPKHIFKLMGKNIITILNYLVGGPAIFSVHQLYSLCSTKSGLLGIWITCADPEKFVIGGPNKFDNFF